METPLKSYRYFKMGKMAFEEHLLIFLLSTLFLRFQRARKFFSFY